MPLAFVRIDGPKARVPISRLPFFIGSDPDRDLVLLRPGVRGRHAKVKVLRGEVMLSAADDADLFVNGLLAPFFTLRSGDVITVGDDGPRLRFQQRIRLDAFRPGTPLATAWLRDNAFVTARGPFAYPPGRALGGADPERGRVVDDPDGGAPLVVKILGGVRGTSDADHHLRLLTALAGAAHPHVAPVLDGGVVRTADGNQRWLVTRWVEGRTAAERIGEGTLLPAGIAAGALAAGAAALAHLHARGVVHRDIAPGNVVLRPDGSAALIDPGHAVLEDARRDAPPGVVGTPGYLAPEAVLAGGPPATRAADVYGLAAVGYALLVGRPPAAGEDVLDVLARSAHRPPSPADLGVAVPPELERLLFRALDADPRRRPDAASLARDLQAQA